MVNNYHEYGIIDSDSNNDIKNLTVKSVHSNEYISPAPTVLYLRMR